MNKRILLVDGDIGVAVPVKEMLESMGYLVRMETSGEAALAVFDRNTAGFDLVIAELGMPDISGFLLIGKLLKMRPNIPIVLLSSPEGQAQSIARESGIRWFGLKPLSMVDLARTVESALTGGLPEGAEYAPG